MSRRADAIESQRTAVDIHVVRQQGRLGNKQRAVFAHRAIISSREGRKVSAPQ